MILIITFVSIFLSCPTFLCSAKYVYTSKPICLESFSCPDFGPFKFPFYNTTDTRCGLIKVNCTPGNESIQFGGHSYEIMNKYFGGPSVSIQNATLKTLIDTNSCEALVNNFTSPTPQLFSISITPLMTLFKCPKHHNHSTELDAYFDQPNYNSYNKCKHHNFYYKHPISTTSVPSDLPNSCEVIQLPGRVQVVNGEVPDYTDIFSLLTSQFYISFWSPSCNECRKKGDCPNHDNFWCSEAKKDKKLILKLALAGSAFILVLFTAMFITSRRYKKNPFLYFLSKEESPNSEDRSFFFGVVVFSYTELEDATKIFDPSHELGDGGFGTVYYGKLQDGREVAVKRLYDHNYKRLQHFVNEDFLPSPVSVTGEWQSNNSASTTLSSNGDCISVGQQASVGSGKLCVVGVGRSGQGKPIIKLILVLARSFIILMLSSVIFIIWDRNKRNPFSYVSSKNKSPNLEEESLFCGVSVFSYSELQDATKTFIPSNELGDGGFGAVYYGKLLDMREVAVKRLYEHNYKRIQQFMNEIEILTRLRHPNLVVLYGCTSWQSHELLLVYEYISNGTLVDHLHGEHANPSLLTWPVHMKIAIETQRTSVPSCL
ncbi:hypothetical protein M8C21_004396 [Ambrosia artemisiifolia]|uniref:Protein kinase domain-containing protein n=1 Tax=Ambrosia artemisiifolia TaxID=4212 RepID=A0AAD5CDM7_AMBAR|nr:hypothetical protein M8C21_004396 [Ambrosia artemisiifolia]